MSADTRQPPNAYRRYLTALQLLQDYGFDVEPPAHMPRGFAEFGDPHVGVWHLRGVPQMPGASYIELNETTDTRLSYPAPSHSYAYLLHLELLDKPNRNISFHKDPTKPRSLQYHWHEYPDGERRSEPVATGFVSLRWFLASAWEFLAEPDLTVEALFDRNPPPGPDDPS